MFGVFWWDEECAGVVDECVWWLRVFAVGVEVPVNHGKHVVFA